jgi:signal transduction histidine kinase/DNA-binding NarL/FixJ family response regulator
MTPLRTTNFLQRRPSGVRNPWHIGVLRAAPLFALAMALVAIAADLSAEFLSPGDTQMHLLEVACLIALCVVAATVLVREGARLPAEVIADDRAGQLHLKKEAAETANVVKSRYLSNVSHELRSPLNAIYGYAQLMERGDQVSSREAAHVIRRCAEHMTSLVDGLLDISQLENGIMRVKHETIRFEDFLDHIFWMLRPSAQAKGLDYRADYPERLPEYVRGDQSRLRQVLINLLSNAIKFTDSGSITFKVRYVGQIATFEVIDTGPGIALADRERIFDPFERGGDDTQQSQPGVGLGLPITQAIVHILGGDITLDSTPGQGSRFKVTLMMGQITGSVSDRPASRNIVGYEGPRQSILVVDDDIQQLSFLRSLLESLGFDVAAIPNGETAVALCAHRQFDLALLDISLPGMSGWEIASYLREKMGQKLRIVMLSANAHEFHKPETQVIVHDLFLVKPVEFNVLLEALGGLLNLSWKSELSDPNAPSRPASAPASDLSPEAMIHVERLRDLVRIGHIRGVEAEIAALDATAPQARELIAKLYDNLDRFDLAAMMRNLEDV